MHVPPGTVHAILAGSLLFEVQNPSNVTWRIDDHGRVGLDGQPRRLHRAEASGLLAEPTPEPETLQGGVLSAARFELRVLAPGTTEAPEAQALHATHIATVTTADGQSFTIPAGRTAWLPCPVRAVDSGGWMVAARARVS